MNLSPENQALWDAAEKARHQLCAYLADSSRNEGRDDSLLTMQEAFAALDGLTAYHAVSQALLTELSEVKARAEAAEAQVKVLVDYLRSTLISQYVAERDEALAATAVLGEAVFRFVKIHEDKNISIAVHSLLHRELVKEFKRALTALPAAAEAHLEELERLRANQIPAGCRAACEKCGENVSWLLKHGATIGCDSAACPVKEPQP